MVRRTIAEHGPHPVDAHVGSRVRLRRTLLGMNQTQLGEALGVTYQQVQNYELGANRMGASRLWHLTEILDVPLSFFFDGLVDEAKALPLDDWLLRRETLELERAYYPITDPEIRKRLFELFRALAKLTRG